jgi:hypothetical protein
MTMRIFSSAEKRRRVLRRMSLIALSADSSLAIGILLPWLRKCLLSYSRIWSQWLRREARLTFDADAFVVVEAEGEPGERYRAVAPGGVPLAFTNPIVVDADGDGRWQAPGLRKPLPEAITNPDDAR